MGDSKKTDCVYQILVRAEPHISAKQGEHLEQDSKNTRKRLKTSKTRRFTREQKRVSTVIEHTSTITDHADRNNCIIDWEGAKVIDGECNRNDGSKRPHGPER